MDKNRYRIKVNGLYVTSVSVTFSKSIDLSEKEYQPKWYTEREKDFVLKHFPDAEVRKYKLVESDKF